MGTASLCDVINDLAAGRRTLPKVAPRPRAALGELDAFILLDDILASLHGHYMAAKKRRAAAIKEHGADSPMADIAADMEDSAWCAMQTRLMELRSDGSLMRIAQKMMRESEQDIERAKQDDKDKKALSFYHRMETARMAKERNKNDTVFEWLIILYLIHHAWRLPFPALGIQQQRVAA